MVDHVVYHRVYSILFTFYDIKMIEFAGKKKRNHSNKKLTRVLSTKISIDDYDRFQKRTDDAYRCGGIDKPSMSEFLRYLVIYRSNRPSIIDLIANTN
jgi:hypothetical protein